MELVEQQNVKRLELVELRVLVRIIRKCCRQKIIKQFTILPIF